MALEHAGATAGTVSTDSDILVRGGTLLLWEPRSAQLRRVTAADCAGPLDVHPRQVSRVRLATCVLGSVLMPTKLRQRQQLLDIALLAGNDYGVGVRQVGLKRAVQLLHRNATAEGVSVLHDALPHRCWSRTLS